MKKMVFLTRPIAPPWDEASKNFAVYLATHIHIPNIQFLLLTTSTRLPKLPSHVTQIPIHITKALTLQSKLRLFWYLLRTDVKHFHSLFVFTPLTGFVIKTLKIIRGFKIIQTVSALSKYHVLSFTVFGDEVVCFSQTTANILNGNGIRASVIPPAVPLEIFKATKKENIIAFLGELHRQKSYAIVNKLIDLLLISLPDYQIITGFRTIRKPAEEKKLVQKLKQKYAKSDRVTFVDVVEDMPKLLGKTKLVVFPATAVTEKFDYPLVLLESLASATPVVISSIGPLGELTILPGVLTPSQNSAEAFLTVIMKTLNSFQKHSNDARMTAEKHFSIHNVAKKYEALYKKIL